MPGLSVSQMRQGRANNGTGPIPTQTFRASDIAGTVVPRVGSAQSTSGTSLSGQFATVQPMHIVIIILLIIGVGYLLHHFNFEESVGEQAAL
jgi:hypothetical protein